MITITLNQCNLNNGIKLTIQLKSCIKLVLKSLILYTYSRGMRRVRHAVHGRGEEKCIQGFGGETEGKRPAGKPRHRRKDNIKK
jgi:hypothetical protein